MSHKISRAKLFTSLISLLLYIFGRWKRAAFWWARSECLNLIDKQKWTIKFSSSYCCWESTTLFVVGFRMQNIQWNPLNVRSYHPNFWRDWNSPTKMTRGEPWTWIISISWVFDHCLAMQWEISETLSATLEKDLMNTFLHYRSRHSIKFTSDICKYTEHYSDESYLLS